MLSGTMLDMDRTPVKRRRRWFRFSMRTLMVVITLLSVWLGIQVNAARRQKEAVAVILSAGGTVNYDYQLKPRPAAPYRAGQFSVSYFSMFFADHKSSPEWPTWMRDQFGDDYFRTAAQVYIHLNDPIAARNAINELANLHAVKCVQLRSQVPHCQIEDSDLNPLGELNRLERLWIIQTRATGKFLSRVRNPSSMIQLSLEQNDIDDAAVEEIGKMTNLENLVLRENARITDAGLAHLSKLTKLKVLVLEQTGVTDAGLTDLKGLNSLTFLDLRKSRATSDGIHELQRVLPNCRFSGP
jgi:hypothetical protein